MHACHFLVHDCAEVTHTITNRLIYMADWWHMSKTASGQRSSWCHEEKSHAVTYPIISLMGGVLLGDPGSPSFVICATLAITVATCFPPR